MQSPTESYLLPLESHLTSSITESQQSTLSLDNDITDNQVYLFSGETDYLIGCRQPTNLQPRQPDSDTDSTLTSVPDSFTYNLSRPSDLDSRPIVLQSDSQSSDTSIQPLDSNAMWAFRTSSRRSWIWRHGERVTENGKRYWKCNVCIRHPKRYAEGGTTH